MKYFNSRSEILVAGFPESHENNKEADVTRMLHFLITLKFHSINAANRKLAVLTLWPSNTLSVFLSTPSAPPPQKPTDSYFSRNLVYKRPVSLSLSLVHQDLSQLLEEIIRSFFFFSQEGSSNESELKSFQTQTKNKRGMKILITVNTQYIFFPWRCHTVYQQSLLWPCYSQPAWCMKK